jgi:lipoate-protein ligase A
MNKFTFVVDIVTDSPAGIEPSAVADTILASVDGIGNMAAVHPVKVTALKEQGFKVWRARVAGITEESVNPKPVKAEKVEAEVASAS